MIVQLNSSILSHVHAKLTNDYEENSSLIVDSF